MLEDRVLAKGDFAVVDNETYVGGSATRDAHAEDVVLEIGSDRLIDEFENNLPGMKVGETRSVEVQFPEDHAEEKLAGKKVLYRVTLKEIKKREMPELSEEFAKEVGAESIEDLKTKIREELTQHHAEDRKTEIREKLLDKILEKVTFDVPPAMLDRQLRALYDSAQRVLGEQGRVLDRASFENLKEGLKEKAERRVRELLILEAISTAEKLSVTEQDLDAHFETLAQKYQQPAPAVRAYYLQEGRINALVNVLAEEKVLDFLEKASQIGE
jgi:trigger factor